jgi:hypothetical protein
MSDKLLFPLMILAGLALIVLSLSWPAGARL